MLRRDVFRQQLLDVWFPAEAFVVQRVHENYLLRIDVVLSGKCLSMGWILFLLVLGNEHLINIAGWEVTHR